MEKDKSLRRIEKSESEIQRVTARARERNRERAREGEGSVEGSWNFGREIALYRLLRTGG